MGTTGDVVLIYCEDQPVFFGRIEDISSDQKRDWYRVRLLVLQIPLKEVHWILRSEYINGESFTMNGRNMRIEKVAGLQEPEPEGLASDSDLGKQHALADDKVISIFDRKRD